LADLRHFQFAFSSGKKERHWITPPRATPPLSQASSYKKSVIGLRFEPNAEIGQKRRFFKGLTLSTQLPDNLAYPLSQLAAQQPHAVT
jgi:hypothetical protein